MDRFNKYMEYEIRLMKVTDLKRIPPLDFNTLKKGSKHKVAIDIKLNENTALYKLSRPAYLGIMNFENSNKKMPMINSSFLYFSHFS